MLLLVVCVSAALVRVERVGEPMPITRRTSSTPGREGVLVCDGGRSIPFGDSRNCVCVCVYRLVCVDGCVSIRVCENVCVDGYVFR